MKEANLAFGHLRFHPDAAEIGDGDQGGIDFVAELAFDDADFHHFAGDGRGDHNALLELAGLEAEKFQTPTGLIAHTHGLFDGGLGEGGSGLGGEYFFLRHGLVLVQIHDTRGVGFGFDETDLSLPDGGFRLHEGRFGFGHDRAFHRYEGLTAGHEVA